ncbi:hypothetical protein [Thermogemmatispora carboxidivorans]|uniref:hypothetical protein n=1 Tax=Thermogemmatispora carboxidivorans TaxID=1382306 RepID=UPI00069B35E2|nr:hypothetical protein [Thermogemmatispora carboxidivorans]
MPCSTQRVTVLRRNHHFSFQGNRPETRYGWLKLTPAHSVTLIKELLAGLPPGDSLVLDPFCGTGTTALACAEEGIPCETTDINPFLVWLAQTKTYPFSRAEIELFMTAASDIAAELSRPGSTSSAWKPSLYQIEKWWDASYLEVLARLFEAIQSRSKLLPRASLDLLHLAFCRTLMAHSRAGPGHQSLSFRPAPTGYYAASLFEDTPCAEVLATWQQATQSLAAAAYSPIKVIPRCILGDARALRSSLGQERYTLVLTSPPYPNRISYIRELRPYMYWLGYLKNGREAGELDWLAIGGTWGSATSQLNRWEPPPSLTIPFDDFPTLLARIADKSQILSKYVHKYFCDMYLHVQEIKQVLRSSGKIYYIIGNAKFYDVMIPVETIFAAMLGSQGFCEIEITTLRKRSSKKELFEYVISARKP